MQSIKHKMEKKKKKQSITHINQLGWLIDRLTDACRLEWLLNICVTHYAARDIYDTPSMPWWNLQYVGRCIYTWHITNKSHQLAVVSNKQNVYRVVSFKLRYGQAVPCSRTSHWENSFPKFGIFTFENNVGLLFVFIFFHRKYLSVFYFSDNLHSLHESVCLFWNFYFIFFQWKTE